jgi:C_GCAxxG_C_C family probable redox protein
MPSEQAQRALALFDSGFNCAQAICAAYAPALGLDEPTALRAAQAFGGGIAHRGETCGALSGALIVLGLKYGKVKALDNAARDLTYAKVQELFSRFESLHDSTRCRTLIGFDLTDPAQCAAAKETGVFKNTCPALVRDAAEILEELL